MRMREQQGANNGAKKICAKKGERGMSLSKKYELTLGQVAARSKMRTSARRRGKINVNK